MRRNVLYSAFFGLVSAAIVVLLTATVNATTELQKPPIENHDTKNVNEKAHPQFSWGSPGPSSPVLHPGSVKGAGMKARPLADIDTIMTNMIDRNVMPGAVTLVARRGHIVQQKAYGNAIQYQDDSGNEVNNPLPMRKDTIFDIASLSKIITTIAAMTLYEQGEFDLDDPVADYIPEFAQNGKENVTIRQLMTHTSGFTTWIPLYTIGDSRQDRLQYVFAYPLENKPGTAYTYSDLNMITLASIVERLSGMRLDDYVAETITEPLNMSDTMYNPPEELKERIAATEYQPSLDRGLVWGDVHDENAWSLDGVAGHAGVFSTVNDLAKLGHMMINDGQYGNQTILKPDTVELLADNQTPQYPGDEHGLGWEIAQGWYMDALSDPSAIGHTGYTGTSMVVNRQNETIAILMTNRVHPSRNTVSTNPARRQFARQVADAIPVSVPEDQDAWFAGYDDASERMLSADVNVTEDTSLSFDTWYRIEQGYDKGTLEISASGENWTNAGFIVTGSSENWQTHKVHIPAGTKHIRFNYQTDANTNGRGWYISEVTLMNGDDVRFKSNTWTRRNH